MDEPAAPCFSDSTRELIRFLPADGDAVRYRWAQLPGGAIIAHRHPAQEEVFAIDAGEAVFTLDGREVVARAGDVVTVPAGALHAVRNPGAVPVTGHVTLRPALGARAFHEAMAGLAAEGLASPTGVPRNPLRAAAVFWGFRRDIRVPGVPGVVYPLVLAPLAGLARLVGIRAFEARWATAGVTAAPAVERLAAEVWGPEGA